MLNVIETQSRNENDSQKTYNLLHPGRKNTRNQTHWCNGRHYWECSVSKRKAFKSNDKKKLKMLLASTYQRQSERKLL